MTLKERVRAAISHKQPGRVPANFEFVGIVAEKLMKHYAANDFEQVYQKLEIDIRPVAPAYIGPELKSWKYGDVPIENIEAMYCVR